jgi:hypothetical protein
VIVQRGETALAEQLRALTPPGVLVIADRRVHDRRTASESTPNNRRRQDRRRPPSANHAGLRGEERREKFIVARPPHLVIEHDVGMEPTGGRVLPGR